MCSGSLVLGNPGDMLCGRGQRRKAAVLRLRPHYTTRGLCTAKNSAARTAEGRPNQRSCFQRFHLGFLTYKVVFMNSLRKLMGIVDQGQMKCTSFISIVL